MAKKTKQPAKKRVYRKLSAKGVADLPSKDTFSIETSPPEPYAGKGNPETQVFKEKLRVTMEQLKPGQAFTIPLQKWVTARRWLTEYYETQRFVMNRIQGNKEMIRVYWIKIK